MSDKLHLSSACRRAKISAESSSVPPVSAYWGWTRAHQAGIAVLLLFCLIFLSVELYHRSAPWGSDVRLTASRPRLAENSIDPNTADWASLVRLPGVGPARATKLLNFRVAAQKAHPGRKAFRSLNDLRAIPTFGPKTVRHLAPWLRFSIARGANTSAPAPKP